jgi:hypothetical protein
VQQKRGFIREPSGAGHTTLLPSGPTFNASKANKNKLNAQALVVGAAIEATGQNSRGALGPHRKVSSSHQGKCAAASSIIT